MAFGWTSEPLVAEQKIANLFYTIDHALETLQRARRNNNPLMKSEISELQFNWTHGYRAVMGLDKGPARRALIAATGEVVTLGGVGYWMVYSDRIGSLGDDRHKWPVWDAHQLQYEPLPRGLLTRELPHDYLAEVLPPGPWKRVTEDHLIVATYEKNKRAPKLIPVFRNGKIIRWDIVGQGGPADNG